MGLFGWFSKNDSVDDGKSSVIVKNLRSKGYGNTLMHITVENIRKGIAIDSSGYENEVVLYTRMLRKNKRDR